MLSQNHLYMLLVISVCFLFQKITPQLSAQKDQTKKNKKEVLFDFNWFIFNEVIFSFILVLASTEIHKHLTHSLSFITWDIREIHYSIQLIIFLLFIDLISYVAHWSVHYLKPMWNIHKLHHSVLFMNPLASFRHSTLSVIYFFLSMAIFGSIITVNNEIRDIVFLITISMDIFQHTDIKIRIPYFLNYFIILPHNHFYHHSKENYKPHGQNFGLVFPFWDILFGTFYLPEKIETEIGLNKDDLPNGFIKKSLYPLIK